MLERISFVFINTTLYFRNVTVSEELNVKVSDYAMFCEEFVEDYHIMPDGSRLPLRWMAWESLLMVSVKKRLPLVHLSEEVVQFKRYIDVET